VGCGAGALAHADSSKASVPLTTRTQASRWRGTLTHRLSRGHGVTPIAHRATGFHERQPAWVGTGDPHLQAAEQDLTLECKSATLPQLHAWAQQQATQSKFRTVGIYSGPLGFGYNPELLAKKKLPVPKTWADLLKPEYKGEIQVANPAASGTAYTTVSNSRA
jgi:iron(III) transport system substrate-binding protein